MAISDIRSRPLRRAALVLFAPACVVLVLGAMITAWCAQIARVVIEKSRHTWQQTRLLARDVVSMYRLRW